MVGGRFWGFWNFQLCLPYLYRVQNMPSQNMPQGCKDYSESRACKQQIQESRSDLSFSSWEQEVNAYVKDAILIPVERKPFLLLESGNLCEQTLLLTLTFLLTFPQLTVLAQILCLVFVQPRTYTFGPNYFGSLFSSWRLSERYTQKITK